MKYRATFLTVAISIYVASYYININDEPVEIVKFIK